MSAIDSDRTGKAAAPDHPGQRVLFAALMSMVMVFLMTCWITWINIGWVPDFLWRWMRAFLAGWPVGFIIVLLLGPKVQRLSRNGSTWLSRRGSRR